MIKRIYFLTSEIVPFAESYQLATFSKEIPIVFNERKYDFRLMMPKYSFISERRYILREVIRLREMDLTFLNQPVKASVKSAFIPNTKVQVYFLEHDDFYSNYPQELYQESDGGKNRNTLRFCYFAAAALTTLNYLRWKPEAIILNDWQMSLIPLVIKAGMLENDYFRDVKILQILHSKNPLSKYRIADYEQVGLTDPDKELVEKNNKIDCVAAAHKLSDHTLLINTENEDLRKSYLADPVFNKLFEQNSSKITTYNLSNETPEEWQNLADEIIKIVDQL